MENAYSKESMAVIDAEKAYELYWEGLIKDKQAFCCPEPECNAQVTCSNIDKERRTLKQRPHFRCYGIHKKGCPNSESKEVIDEFDDGNQKKNSTYINPQIDVLLLNRKNKNVETTTRAEEDINHERVKRKLKAEIEENGTRKSEYVTIMPIVTKYQKYLEENTLGYHFIENQGKNISYENMFINLEGGEFSWFSNFNRIYFGKVRIKKIRNKQSHFMLIFSKELKYKKVMYKPSAYISSNIINDSYRNKQWLEELIRLDESKEEIIAFIYGRVKINKVYANKDGYFNLEISNAKLDFVDIRYNE